MRAHVKTHNVNRVALARDCLHRAMSRVPKLRTQECCNGIFCNEAGPIQQAQYQTSPPVQLPIYYHILLLRALAPSTRYLASDGWNTQYVQLPCWSYAIRQRECLDTLHVFIVYVFLPLTQIWFRCTERWTGYLHVTQSCVCIYRISTESVCKVLAV